MSELWMKDCKECGAKIPTERAGDLVIPVEAAEVYLNPEYLKANAGGQWVLVDDIPDGAFGPFLVHAECFLGADGKYELA